MKTLHAILIGGVCGAVLSVVGYSQFVSTEMPKAETAEQAVKPLYWVPHLAIRLKCSSLCRPSFFCNTSKLQQFCNIRLNCSFFPITSNSQQTYV